MTTRPLRVLMVGAGAVGQAYGWHLHAGGCAITFYVRPHHLAELQAGLVLYPDLGKPRWTPVEWRDFDVVTSVQEVAARTFDQVWLTVPSPALAGAWLPELAAAWGAAGVVMLQPGLDDRARLLELVPEARLARGVITLSSFHAPLPGQTLARPGMAWWLPPMTPMPLSGPRAITQPAAAALRRGGCPARALAGPEVDAADGSAALMPLVAELETAGWTFAGLRQPAHARRAAAAIREALAVTAHAQGRRRAWFAPLVRGGVLALATRLAPLVVPFDFQAFLHAHFVKVRTQTQQALADYVAKGQAAGLPVAALRELADKLA